MSSNPFQIKTGLEREEGEEGEEGGGREGRGGEGRKEKPHFGSSTWDLTFQSTIQSFGHLSTYFTTSHCSASRFCQQGSLDYYSFGTSSSVFLLVKESL